MARIATVTSVTGKVFALSADGKIRPLKVGDAIEKDEIVQTAAGAHVELKMVDGQSLAVAPEQNIKIDESVVQTELRPTPQDAAVNAGTVDAVIQALERGGDLSQDLEAPAAGLGGGAGGQGNAGFVRLLRIVEGVDPLAYEYRPPEFGAIQTLESVAIATEQPVLSVGVSVSTSIGTTPGNGAPTLIPGTESVVKGSVTAVNVPEGSSGSTVGTPVTFQITLDAVATTDVTVTYTIVPGTATDPAGQTQGNPADYHNGAVTGTVTIPAGYIGFSVTEYIVGDIRVEGNETFQVVLSNPIGATLLNDTATVTIVDDDHPPVAVVDSATMTEDDTSVSGNVLGNDTDVDGQALTSVVGGPIVLTTADGTLRIEANGNFTFTPSAATLARMSGMDQGEQFQVSFRDAYQTTDGANVSNFAGVNITINGLNDPPTITTRNDEADPTNSAGNDKVFESGLGSGSSPSAADRTASGTITLADADGLDDIQGVQFKTTTTAGEQTYNFTDEQLEAIGTTGAVPLTFSTQNGVVTLTGYNAATGVITYSFELTSRTTDVDNAATAETNTFTVAVTDEAGTTPTYSTPTTVTIEIVDDGPAITVSTVGSADALVVDESVLATNATADFANNFSNAANYGADGAGTVTSAYTLGINTATASGLVDTATGQAVVLSLNAGVVEGKTATGGDVVFTVSVSGAGVVTLDQVRAITHPTTNPDEGRSLAADDLITLTRTDTITDKDGDTASNAATVNLGSAISFEDDGPAITAGTVADGAITLTTQDAETDGVPTDTDTASASFAAAFLAAAVPVYGADGAGSTVIGGYTLSVTDTAAGLNSNGLAITLAKVGNDVVGSTTAGEVFRISVGADGTVTLTQSAEIDHVGTGNDLQIALAAGKVSLSATATTTDGDGDTATATVSADLGGNIRFDDDVPSVTASSALITSSGTAATETGTFSYSLGADTLTYSGNTVHDFINMSLAGKVGGIAVTSSSVTPVSESATQSQYNFSFVYANSPTTTTTATGTLTFDKSAGTYTASLDAPLQYSQLFTTSGMVQKFSYDHAGDAATSSTRNPDVVVSQLSDNFFVQFSATKDTFSAGGNNTLGSGETISGQDTTWVSISNTANGVAGDTLGQSEVIDMDFFTSNPGSNLSATPTASLSGMFLKFDNIGTNEDLVMVLKLYDTVTHTTTTKTFILGAEDIYKQGAALPAGYNVTLDNNDGVVIIESNDFNAAGENWVIQGAQVITSTENLSGVAYNLNGATGSSGGSNLSTTASFGGSNDPTDDHDVVKITDIGFVSTAASSPVADLNFSFQVQDADGDTSSTQTLNATFINGEIYQGTVGADVHVGTSNSDLIDGGLGNDTLTGGLGSDVFKWALNETGADTIKDFKIGTNGDMLDLRDLLVGEHANNTSLDGYLDFSANGSGQTVISVHAAGTGQPVTQTITLENVQYADLQTYAGGTSDATIISKLLTDGNLKTDI